MIVFVILTQPWTGVIFSLDMAMDTKYSVWLQVLTEHCWRLLARFVSLALLKVKFNNYLNDLVSNTL